jgi:hypothetical protein
MFQERNFLVVDGSHQMGLSVVDGSHRMGGLIVVDE